MKIALITTSILLILFSCKKDAKICDSYTELIETNHLVDISPINEAPELIDTLNKYPQLQVYKVINDQYITGMHCRVFYKGLIVFTDYYTLFKNKTTWDIYSGDSTIVDSINLYLSPDKTYIEAIDIARKVENFDKGCISYRLGIYDINRNSSNQQKSYKLVWKIEGSDSGARFPYVYLDATTGHVYDHFDGVIF